MKLPFILQAVETEAEGLAKMEMDVQLFKTEEYVPLSALNRVLEILSNYMKTELKLGIDIFITPENKTEEFLALLKTEEMEEIHGRGARL